MYHRRNENATFTPFTTFVVLSLVPFFLFFFSSFFIFFLFNHAYVDAINADVFTIFPLKFSQTPNDDNDVYEEEIVLNDDARVRCIQKTICLENQKLFQDLGVTGKILGKYLTYVTFKIFIVSHAYCTSIGRISLSN